MRTFLPIILFLAGLFFTPAIYAAEIVINEVYANPENENDEFIELYNTSDNEITISNWKISDKVKTYTIQNINILGKGFYTLEKSATGIALNNSDEEVTLKDTSDNIVDSVSYSETLEGKSWSRIPDGAGGFVNNSDPTKNAINATPPTPTSSPTPSPSPSPTPIKTPTPTPTKIPTPTPTVRPAVNTPTPIFATQIPKITSFDKEEDDNEQIIKGEVLGAKSKPLNTPTPSETLIKGQSRSFNLPSPAFFIIGGLSIITGGCGILLYREWKKQKSEVI